MVRFGSRNLGCPFRAGGVVGGRFLGRCPRLPWFAPSGRLRVEISSLTLPGYDFPELFSEFGIRHVDAMWKIIDAEAGTDATGL